MARQYGNRPSALFGISESDPWLAFDFDRAVNAFVRHVENELDEVTLTESEQKDKGWRQTLKAKKKKVLERLLWPEKRGQVTMAKLAERGVPVVKSSSRTDVSEG